MDPNKTKIYYGYTLEDLKKKEVLEDYKVIWPHVHTVYSMSTLNLNRIRFKGRFIESIIEIPKLLKMADKQGISEILITDHDEPRKKKYKTHYSPIKGALKAVREAKKYNVNVIPGQEILFTPKSQNINVHILLFPLTKDLTKKLDKGDYKNGTINELSAFCKDNEIKMVAPHPLADEEMKVGVKTLLYDPDIPKKIYNDNMKYFDAVSIINGFSPGELNMATILATRRLDVIRKTHNSKPIAKIGESDAHSYETLNLAGTLIPQKFKGGLIKAIEKGCTIPFGAFGANKELLYSWGRNAYNINLKCAYYLKKHKCPSGSHNDTIKVYEKVHGPKFNHPNALINFMKRRITSTMKIYAIKLFRRTFPLIEPRILKHRLWLINCLYDEIIKSQNTGK